MGNSGLKQHLETAKKTGVFTLSKAKLEEFPKEVKQLKDNLRTLDLSENKIVHLPNDLNAFELLKNLNVHQNRLSHLPDSIGSLPRLEILNVSGNQLSQLPSSMAKLTHLKQVDLSNNHLTEFPAVFGGLKHLDVLDLSRNRITLIPAHVETLYVIELNLNQNQIQSISEMVCKCSRLKTLRVQENCLNLHSIEESRVLGDSSVTNLAVEGNLFELKQLADLDGYEAYMQRYTAVKKKIF